MGLCCELGLETGGKLLQNALSIRNVGGLVCLRVEFVCGSGHVSEQTQPPGSAFPGFLCLPIPSLSFAGVRWGLSLHQAGDSAAESPR